MNDQRTQRRLAALERAESRRHARARAIRRGVAGLGLLGLVALPLVGNAYPDAPNIFSPGDPVTADAMNDNFQHLVDGVTSVEAGVAPIGSVVAWAGSDTMLPPGWLLCDGTEYSSATYPELASAIGSAHGGDGASSFNVPDLRGRFIRGVDLGAGRDPDATDRVQPQMGSGASGDNVGSVQGSVFGEHAHGTAINFPSNMPGPGAFGTGTAGVFGDVMFGAGTGSVDAQRSSLEGGAETRPVNVYLNFIIRAE